MKIGLVTSMTFPLHWKIMKCCLSLIRKNAKLATLSQSPPFKYSFVYVSHTSQLLGDRLIHVCTSVAQQKISYLPFVLAQLLRTASNQRFSVSAVSKVPASTCPTQFWVNSCQSNNRNSDWKNICLCHCMWKLSWNKKPVNFHHHESSWIRGGF